MADGIIGSVGVAVVPDAQNFWRRFEEQTRAGATDAGRRAGEEWRRGFNSATDRPVVVPVRTDTARASTDLAALRAQIANLGNIRIDTGSLTAGQLASITGATNRLSDAQDRLTRARAELEAVTEREGHTEDELAAAQEIVARAERDHAQASLRLAAAQETVAAAQERARVAAEREAAAQDRSARSTKAAADAHLSLLGAALALSPALVPIAGAAALGGAALVEMGAAGALAIKGISDDIKAANADGIKFSAGLNVLKGDFGELTSTAAHNVLGAFQEATAKLHAVLPSVNNDLGESAHLLGDIGGHILTGLLGGLQNFSPALLTIEQGVDRLAERFEAWATGPGGAKFGEALTEDLQHVGPLISNITSLVGHLVTASNATGLGIVDSLNGLAKALDAIPTPVLSGLVAGVVALKVAGTVSGLMDKLAASIRGVTDAEGGGGAATGRGRLAAIVGKAGEIAAAYAATTAVINAAAAATDKWATSTNDVQYGAHYITTTFKDLLNFNFKGFWGDITGGGAAKAEAEVRGHIDAINNATKALSGNTKGLGLQWATVAANAQKASSNILTVRGNQVRFSPSSQVTGDFDPNVVAVSSATRIANQEATTYQATIRGLMTTLSAFYVQMTNAPLTQATQAYTQQASSIDKANRSLQDFLTSGAKTSYTYKGITVGVNAWDAALKKTNGDVAAAEGIINGQIDALRRQQGIYGDLSEGSLRLGEAVGAAAAKYKLTTDQVDSYAAALGISSDAVARGTISQTQFVAAIGDVTNAFSHGNAAINQWVAAVGQFNQAGDTAAARGQLIGEALRAANGDALAYAGSMASAASATGSLVDAFTQQFNQLDQQAASAAASGAGIARAQRQVETANARVTAAQERLNHVRNTAGSTTAQITAAEANLTSAQNSAANAASRLAAAQTAAGSAATLAYKDTERAAIHFTNTVHGLTAEIDTSAKGAGPLIQQLQAMQTTAMAAAAATYQHEDSLHKASAADDAFAVYVDGTRNALIRQHTQLHLTTKQAKALADEYFGIKNSGDLKKQIELIGQDKVLTALDNILDDLDVLSGKKTVLDIQINARNTANVQSGAGRGVGGRGPRRLATGGPVEGPGPRGVDSVPIIAAPGEWVMSDKAVAKFGPGFFASLNAGIMPTAFARPDRSGRSARPVVVNQTFHGVLPTPADRLGPQHIRRAASVLGRI